jgi:RyR domain
MPMEGPRRSRKTTVMSTVGGRLTAIEVMREARVPAGIGEDVAEQLAQAIHQAYVDNSTARGDSPVQNPSMRPWDELPQDLRQSNLAQAADIGAKLDAIGSAVVPESAAPEFAFTQAEIELLARMEHERWVQERQARGHVHGPKREGNQHPDLVDWRHLSEDAREKDRDAVRELPVILRQAGFQIVRRSPQ